MWRKLLEWFTRPTPETLRARQLADARLELVAYSHAADNYNGHIKTLQSRIARLEKEMRADKPA